MGRAGPMVRVRGVERKSSRKRERDGGARREEAEGKHHTFLFSVLFNQFLTTAPEYIYVLHLLEYYI